jgi:hypothetical protein
MRLSLFIVTSLKIRMSYDIIEPKLRSQSMHPTRPGIDPQRHESSSLLSA